MLYRAASLVLKPVSHALYRPRISGAENVPRTGGVILASNHLSFVDSFAIPLSAPRKVHFLAKSDYFTRPGALGALQRELVTTLGAIPVDRDSAHAAQESLDAALQVLLRGDVFGIYPEGTRSRDGRLYRGRTGVAWLALTAAAPVVPVGLRGTEQVAPVGTHVPRLATVTVSFGAPIHPEAYAGLPAGRARRQLTDDVMDAIAALTGQDRSPDFNALPPTPED
ncbi:MAG: lysophospholipid acyltransferase family protein [Dermatophilaceae bacterium]